jgi:threonine/homoserine/homoserine lactone efflux protein
MLPLPNLLAFLAAAIVLVIMPGPTVLFVVGRSLSLGRRGGLLSVVGNALGLVPIVVAVAFGVGALIAESVVIFTIIKYVGAAYIIYLGIQAIRHRKRVAAAIGAGVAHKSAKRMLAEGFLVGVSNPKTIAFFLAVLPQFVAPHAGWVPGQLLLLGGIFIGLALVSDGAWALAAGSARDWFARSPKRVENLGTTGGAMMIGLGGVLALTGSSK